MAFNERIQSMLRLDATGRDYHFETENVLYFKVKKIAY